MIFIRRQGLEGEKRHTEEVDDIGGDTGNDVGGSRPCPGG
jgi:hypothetical protein